MNEVLSDYSLLIHVATTVATISGAIIAVQKIAKNAKNEKEAYSNERDEQANKILKSAKEEADLIKVQLEAKIDIVSTKVLNLESSVEKELSHIKELHNNEIRNLGEKIEQLRKQLNDQHAQLLSFLTKLIEK